MNQPKVFISYSQDDAAWVQPFAEALRRQGVDVWFDTSQVKIGESVRDAIEEGLRRSDAIVTVLSRANVPQPNNVLFEFGVALGAKKRLIPIVAPDLADSEIPFGLRTRKYLRKGTPDVAAREVAEALLGKAA